NPISRFVGEIPQELRKTSGLGSSGFSGTGFEKRGSRRGISGSGSEAGAGRVFGTSSASGSRSTRSSASATGRAVSASSFKKDAAKMSFAVGDVVDHKTFGRGKVTKVDGDTLHVYFTKLGQTKKLLKDYAPIVKIGG
ncbi:MAG: DNA helicase UvrD, partial [Eggerthellales bacterium]|nr:DNA helicase UvrD [Eggerthellales bacterium]